MDGLHQQDLDNYIAEFPYSNIAQLAETGTKYENYFLPPPTDSWPALATQITGGGPQTHGIIYGPAPPTLMISMALPAHIMANP